jgi:hypothetical protein
MTELLDGGIALIDESVRNGGRVEPETLHRLARNIRLVATTAEGAITKFKAENYGAHCASAGYLALLMSVLRTNRIAQGE